MKRKRNQKPFKLYIVGMEYLNNNPVFKDKEKLKKFLNKYNLTINNKYNTIYHINDNYKTSYSKKKLKRLFQRISKHLKKGILVFIVNDRIKRPCFQDQMYITVLPNKVIVNIFPNDIFDMSYEYLTKKVFPYIDDQTKLDLIKVLNKKIYDLSYGLNKCSLLLNELTKDLDK